MARPGARHPRIPATLMSESLQARYSPASRCFGCGPANEQGLRIGSHEAGEAAQPGELVADWQPLPHHAAFDDILNGARRDYFVGLQLKFNDEDLKQILPFAPAVN